MAAPVLDFAVEGYNVLEGTLPDTARVTEQQLRDSATAPLVRVVEVPRSSYMAPQDDAKAGEAMHEYHLSVAARIDLSEPSDVAPQDDFTAIVLITGCVDPKDDRESAARVPWDAIVVTQDRMRQYPVSLYAHGLAVFNGIYPGAVIGVRGAVLKRNPSTMRPQDVTVTKVIHARVPPAVVASPESSAPSSNAESLRIMFLAGPFGKKRDDARTIISKAVGIAAQRHAHMLVVCGPFAGVPPPKSATSATSLPDCGTVKELHRTIAREAEATRPDAKVAPHRRPVHVVMVPSIDDFTEMPVLPQMSCESTPVVDEAADVFTNVTSNPLEITAGPLRIGVCSFDALTHLRTALLERGVPPKMRPLQPAFAAARSGCYVPRVLSQPGAVDAHLQPLLNFGVASGTQGQAPHLIFYPNSTFSSPIAAALGGAGSPVLLSCSNNEELKTHVALEVTIADVARAASEGCRAETGVSVSPIKIFPQRD